MNYTNIIKYNYPQLSLLNKDNDVFLLLCSSYIAKKEIINNFSLNYRGKF